MPKPQPDIERFKNIILGKTIPKTPPLAELFLDDGIIKIIGEELLGLEWVAPVNRESRRKYRDFQIRVYYALGYDYFWVFGHPSFTVKERTSATSSRAWSETNTGVITSYEDFYRYEWPVFTDEMLEDYYYVSEHLPDGMGMFVANGDGFLEVVMNNLIGYESMCVMMFEEPELIKDVMDKAGEIIFDACVKMLDVPKSAGIFMGDDMGFTTSTLFAPDFYRTHNLPWHKKLAQAAHEKNQLYLLHSCGQLESIMPDLIYDVKIDGKHSYQKDAYDVCDYKQKYGKEIAILGGVDVDMLCRLDEDKLRKYVRHILEICAPGGRYAFGTGNSVADYVPLKNYFIMLDEWLKFSL